MWKYGLLRSTLASLPSALIGTFNRELYLIWKILVHDNFFIRGLDMGTILYNRDFEIEEYRINAFTYFQSGAHHGTDVIVGKGKETPQELFEGQLEETRKFCHAAGYPLIAASSNIRDILSFSGLFREQSFDWTHTCRNLSMAMLFQKAISRYYYSSAHALTEFRFNLNGDMASYEKWLIPYLGTGSIEFYQSNQDWTRMDKVKKISEFAPCYNYLQVCLVKTGNCGQCVKCRRTLMELDALGDDVLEKFKNSFDLETYRRDSRSKWFSNILADKEKTNGEAAFIDEIFVCAAKNHPELLGDLLPVKTEGIQTVRIRNNGVVNIRELPSLRSSILLVAKDGDCFEYCGENSGWIGLRLKDDRNAFVRKGFAELL